MQPKSPTPGAHESARPTLRVWLREQQGEGGAGVGRRQARKRIRTRWRRKRSRQKVLHAAALWLTLLRSMLHQPQPAPRTKAKAPTPKARERRSRTRSTCARTAAQRGAQPTRCLAALGAVWCGTVRVVAASVQHGRAARRSVDRWSSRWQRTQWRSCCRSTHRATSNARSGERHLSIEQHASNTEPPSKSISPLLAHSSCPPPLLPLLFTHTRCPVASRS